MKHKKSILTGLFIAALFAVVALKMFRHDLNWYKKNDAWMQAHFDASIPLYLTPENGQEYFAKIENEDERQKAEDLIKFIAHPQNNPKPSHPISCAVVGNGGSVKDKHYGRFIDGHTYVFRMNNAPTKRYERDVGEKTTYHVIHGNMPVIRGYKKDTITYLVLADFGTDYSTPEGREAYKDKAALRIKWLTTLVYKDKFPKVFIPKEPYFPQHYFPRNFTKFSKRNSIQIANPELLFYIYDKWFMPDDKNDVVYPSIGFKSIILAMHLCDTIDVFGFGADEKGEWSHYFGKPDPNKQFTGYHIATYQEVFIRDMERRGLIRVYR